MRNLVVLTFSGLRGHTWVDSTSFQELIEGVLRVPDKSSNPIECRPPVEPQPPPAKEADTDAEESSRLPVREESMYAACHVECSRTPAWQGTGCITSAFLEQKFIGFARC